MILPFRSIPEQFLDWARSRPDRDGYAVRKPDGWERTSWSGYAAEVRRCARSIIAHDLNPGDRVGLLGVNCPEWAIFDLGAMASGCVPVGIYTTCASEQIRYILQHSEARVVFVSGTDGWERLSQVLADLPDIRCIILKDIEAEVDNPLAISWDEFQLRGAPELDSDMETRLSNLSEHDPGALLYTSGTTGRPKGVLLTHGNMDCAAQMGKAMLPEDSDRFRHLSYLPLAHAAERALSILGPAAIGYTVYFSTDFTRLPQDLKEVRPHIFLGVPRVWEKYRDGLAGRLSELSGAKASLLGRSRRFMLRAHEIMNRGEKLNPVMRLRFAVARQLFTNRIKRGLGLDQVRVFLTGAAPIDIEILHFMASLDIPIREVYGQTEDCGPTSYNRAGATKWGTVGRPFDGLKVKIADDGEILVSGPNVFPGYYKDDLATSETLKSGWLQTGDLGEMDEDGYVHLTGRKKEMIITAGGKNISPHAIEGLLKRDPLVADAIVIGDRRKYLVALFTLQQGHQPVEIMDRLQICVDSVNSLLSRAESIKKYLVLPGSFSIDGGELTPTFKLRRSVILDRYSEEISSLYDD